MKPEEDLQIRIYETVLVTEDGPVVSSAHVPKEIKEIRARVGSGGFPN